MNNYSDKSTMQNTGPMVSPSDASGYSANSDYEVTDEERKDLALACSLYERAKKQKEKYAKDWNTYSDFYKGKQWDVTRPQYRASPVMNIARNVIQTVLPIMTDTEPGFSVGPKEPNDYDFANLLSILVKTWWDTRTCGYQIVETFFYMLTLGTGIIKVTWDPEENFSIGDVKIETVDPRDIFPCDGAVDFDKNCQWVIHRTKKSIAEVKQKFPKVSSEIRRIASSGSNGSDKQDETMQAMTLRGDIVLVSPIDQKNTKTDAVDVQNYYGDDTKEIELIELWINDSTYTEELSDNGKDKITKKKYPRGKLITVIPECKLHCQSAENPYDDGKWPFVRFVDFVIPGQFWGEGEIEHVIPINRIINKIVGNILDYMNMMGNPVWIIDSNSGVTPEMISNQIGLIIVKNPGTVIDRLIPPALPAYIIQLYNQMLQFSDTVTGVHDVTQGRKPVGVTAAEAITTLQDAAQTRIRLKERNARMSLYQLGMLVISRMLQFYRLPRIVKITGKDTTEWPQFVEASIEKNPENGMYKFLKKSSRFDENQGKYIEDMSAKYGTDSKGVFDIDIQTGTSVPFMREKMGSLALKLAQMGLIDQQATLDAVDFKNRDEVLKRMEQKQIEAQKMQQGLMQAQASMQSAPPTSNEGA